MSVSIPTIRLEVDRLKASIIAAFTEEAVRLDADIRAAVEAYCTPENISRVLDSAVRDTLDRAIKDEVESFYRYGAGKSIVRDAVVKRLSDG